MLKRIKLVNFKSFADQEVSLSPLTLLVGANASGKSNFLDAIRFLQGITLGMTVNEVLHGKREGGNLIWPGVRGGAKEIVKLGKKQFEIEADWYTPENQTILRHKITSQPDKGILKKESLETINNSAHCSVFSTHFKNGTEQTAQLSLYDKKGNKVTQLEYDPGSKTGQKIIQHEHNPSRSFLIHAEGKGPYFTEFIPTLAFCSETIHLVNKTLFLDIQPALMRNYAPKQSLELSKQGENISAVLWNLCKDKEKRETLMDWLIELCAPELQDIKFDENTLEEVILMLVEKDGTKISARSLSDGTLKFLGLLTVLLTAPEQSVFVIEEIESGLHPTRLHLLIGLIESVVESRNIQVIATTHSPVVLELLSREHLLNALLFARTEDTDGSQIRRLGDLPYLQEVLEKSFMDHLFTTGWLERAL